MHLDDRTYNNLEPSKRCSNSLNTLFKKVELNSTIRYSLEERRDCLDLRWINLRRDKLQIVAEILEMTSKENAKTRIMQKVKLSSWQVDRYLGFMVETNLLDMVSRGKRKLFKTTEKGLKLLRLRLQILELLELN
jgi:predicted transcriptional regulator